MNKYFRYIFCVVLYLFWYLIKYYKIKKKFRNMQDFGLLESTHKLLTVELQ